MHLWNNRVLRTTVFPLNTADTQAIKAMLRPVVMAVSIFEMLD